MWDASRAIQTQAAILARLDEAVASIHPNHPARKARLNVLGNDRAIVARLVTKRDPLLWDWLQDLECLLSRWKEEDNP